MPNPSHRPSRVYVSSTALDLKDFRQAVIEQIRQLGHDRFTVVCMEDYTAEDAFPLDKCLSDVAACDIYVGLFGFRYGHIPPGHDQAITEQEYREARRKGCKVLLYLASDDVPVVAPRLVDRDRTRIETLREELLNERVASKFATADQLKALIATGLGKYGPIPLTPELEKDSRLGPDAIRATYLQGWITSLCGRDEGSLYIPRSAIPLKSAAMLRQRDGIRQASAQLQKSRSDAEDEEDSEEELILDLVWDCRLLLLFGGPGVGKSTELQYLATKYMTHRLQNSQGALPIILRLRDLSRSSRPIDSVFALAMAAADVAPLANESVRPQLVPLLADAISKETVLLLCDGFDEIADEGVRNSLCSLLESLAASNKLLIIVASSRPEAIGGSFQTLPSFTRATLLPLKGEEIRRYARRWFQAVSFHDDPDQADEVAGEFQAALNASPTAQTLAGTPMQLKAMLEVFDHEGSLPTDAAKIYATLLEVYLDRRPLAGGPLPPWEATPALEWLAYEMCYTGSNQIRWDDAERLIVKRLADNSDEGCGTRRTVPELLDALVKVVGLLTPSVASGVDRLDKPFLEFFHPDFAEYLAARAVGHGRYEWAFERISHDALSAIDHLRRHIAPGSSSLPAIPGAGPRWFNVARHCLSLDELFPEGGLQAILGGTSTADLRRESRELAVLAARLLTNQSTSDPEITTRVIKLLLAHLHPGDRVDNTTRNPLEQAIYDLASSPHRDLLGDAILDATLTAEREHRMDLLFTYERLFATKAVPKTDDNWIEKELATMQHGRPKEVVRATLILGSHIGKVIPSSVVEAFLSKLSATAAEAHTAAWSLRFFASAWNGGPPRWRPDSAQEQRCLEILDDPEADKEVVRNLILLLASQADPRFPQRYLECLRCVCLSVEPSHRPAFVEWVGTPDIVRAFRWRLRDESALVAGIAAMCLALMGHKGELLSSRLLKLLDHPYYQGEANNIYVALALLADIGTFDVLRKKMNTSTQAPTIFLVLVGLRDEGILAKLMSDSDLSLAQRQAARNAMKAFHRESIAWPEVAWSPNVVRLKSEGSDQTAGEQTSETGNGNIKIVEEENDFPFDDVSFVRVGSAHAVFSDTFPASLVARYARLVATRVNRMWNPDADNEEFHIDWKDGATADPSASLAINTDTAMGIDPLLNDDFFGDPLGKNLYFCVLARGTRRNGNPHRVYAYFGLFGDTVLGHFVRAAQGGPFNPKDLKGIVLARSYGEPSDEIREFMALKFSFRDTEFLLELSPE